MEIEKILSMVQISDSLFPIGAYTLSNGLETFVDDERIVDIYSLEDYLKSYLQILPYQDLGVMMLAYKHFEDEEYLVELDRISMAFKLPREVREGSQKLCRRFIRIWERIEHLQSIWWYGEKIQGDICMGNHAIAVGLYAREKRISIRLAAAVYGFNLINVVVTNAVKTVPLSQFEGQGLLKNSLRTLKEKVEIANALKIEEIGIGAPLMDIGAMNHEIMYSRLYMS